MASPSLSWRERLLPGPAATTGYRTVLLIGTTGAGKSTLLRQLIGTDAASEAFPATATFKTTTAETEVLCAPGDYYAVAVFVEQGRARAEIAECVRAAQAALSEGRPADVARDALAAHADERLRLEYIVGPDAIDRGVAALATSVCANPPGEQAAEGLVSQLIAELVAQVAERFPSLRYGQLLWADDAEGHDSWPRCWRFTCEDRALFVAALRRLAGNDRGSYGALLTPLVEAVRVRGPFHPTWAAELPYVMVVDTEGLGHVPASAAALPLSVLSQLDRADRIIVVDDATHPMQAAPLAALRQLATSGHIEDVAVCFTHVDAVDGPNVANDADRRAVLRRAVNQAIGSLAGELAPADWERLRRQIDSHTFFLAGLDRHLSPQIDADRATIGELGHMLVWMRERAATIRVDELRPAYRLGDLRARLTVALERFQSSWRDRLAKVHWRQLQALCVRMGDDVADGYGDLQPVADLVYSINEAVRSFASRPVRWAGLPPSDEQALALVDAFARSMAAPVLGLAREAMAERGRPAWRAAADLSGPGAAPKRVMLIDEGVLAPLLAVTADGGPYVVSRVVEEVRSAAGRLGFDVGDTVVPLSHRDR